MASVVLKIATKEQSFPPGTVAGMFIFEVKKADGTLVDIRETTNTSITVDLPIGKYTTKAVRMASSTGNTLGDPVFVSFEVVDNAPVTIEVCESLSAQQL